MTALHTHDEITSNPLDLLEEFVSANEWRFDRASDSDLVVEIRGRWCDHKMCFYWAENVSAIFFSCRLDQKVPSARRSQVHELLVVNLVQLSFNLHQLCEVRLPEQIIANLNMLILNERRAHPLPADERVQGGMNEKNRGIGQFGGRR